MKCPPRLKHALRQARLRKRIRTQGYVYLIKCNELVKIGITDKPKLRLANMQTGCPYELSLLRYVFSYDADSLELRLHRMFKRFHHRNEWFILPQAILERLTTITDQQFRTL